MFCPSTVQTSETIHPRKGTEISGVVVLLAPLVKQFIPARGRKCLSDRYTDQKRETIHPRKGTEIHRSSASVSGRHRNNSSPQGDGNVKCAVIPFWGKRNNSSPQGDGNLVGIYFRRVAPGNNSSPQGDGNLLAP